MYSPSVYNESCEHDSSMTSQEDEVNLTHYNIFRCFIVAFITIGLIVGNLILSLAINSQHCANILPFETRCLLTSIATNHLATGFLVTAWNTYPSLTSCWPYGVLLCQIQAVLRGSLCQHNSILWILLAIDRYVYATRPLRYRQLSSSKHCVWLVALTWSISFAYYTALVLPYNAFDFANGGLAGCEPVPQTGILMLTSTCLLYFPTTMILLYVYGTVFHSRDSTTNNKTSHCNSHCTSDYCNVQVEESITRTSATMSLAFIINSTPWIIKQIIVACLANEIPVLLDFTLTWSCLSLGMWNPLLCCLLCRPIRDGIGHVLHSKMCCKTSHHFSRIARRSSTWNTELPDGFPVQCAIHNPHNNSPVTPNSSGNSSIPAASIENGERVWGEILERTLSSTSLHRLQRLYPGYHDHNIPPIVDHETWRNKPNNGDVYWHL